MGAREGLVSGEIDRSGPGLGGVRRCAERVVVLPVSRRSDRTGQEAAPAVGTDVAQPLVDTGGTEPTLE